MISSRLACDVLGVDGKRLDNLLLSLGTELGGSGRQGRSRKLSVEILELLAITLLLQRDLGLSAKRGFTLACQLSDSEDGTAPIGVLASLHFDTARLRSVLHNALASATEDHSDPRRGRPTAPRT